MSDAQTLLQDLTLLTAGIGAGGLFSYVFVWFAMKKESFKEAHHYRLLGLLKIFIVACYVGNTALRLYRHRPLEYWPESFLGLFCILLVLLAWNNLKKARWLAPR